MTGESAPPLSDAPSPPSPSSLKKKDSAEPPESPLSEKHQQQQQQQQPHAQAALLAKHPWLAHLRKKRVFLALAALATVAVVLGVVLSVTARQKAKPIDLSNFNSDVTLLYDNDLASSDGKQKAALLVSGKFTHKAAVQKCSRLGDKLLKAKGKDTNILTSYLDIVDKEQKDVIYWVDGGSKDQCHAVGRTGNVFPCDCNNTYAALCAHNPPLANNKKVRGWKTKVASGDAKYNGYRDKRSFVFKGIRYAQQPNRFEHSQVHAATGEHDATELGSACVQMFGGGKEDCLFLNIWTPYIPRSGAKAATTLKPVFFFIHGGGFTGGSAFAGPFDGGNIASRGDAVVVSINYRLGTLGFLALDDGVHSGNYGLGDMVTALDWVRKHIRDFGGDPDRITIAGQSAGAAAVRALLGSPKAIGKYSAAVMQSNLGGYNFATSFSLHLKVKDEVNVHSKPVLQKAGCWDAKSQFECMKNVPAQRIATLGRQARYLTADGKYIPSTNLLLHDNNSTANVPVMLGLMQHDATTYVPTPKYDSLSKQLSQYGWSDKARKHLNDFTMASGQSRLRAVHDQSVRAGTDGMFRCVDQATAAAAAHHKTFPKVFFYEFTRAYANPSSRPMCSPPKSKQFPNGNPSKPYYKCHSGDLPYTFGNIGFGRWPERDGKDKNFQKPVLDSWTSFIRTHDPNPDPKYLAARGYEYTADTLKKAGIWKPVGDGKAARTLRQLGDKMEQVPFVDEKQCADIGLPIDKYY